MAAARRLSISAVDCSQYLEQIPRLVSLVETDMTRDDFVRMCDDIATAFGLQPGSVVPDKAAEGGNLLEAMRGAERAILHIYNATDPLSREKVLCKTQDEIVDLATRAVCFSKEFWKAPGLLRLEYSLEHFSTTELDFSKRVIDAVTLAWGAHRDRPVIVNLPATVERSMPNVYADQIGWIHENIERREGVILSVHPHNDRGTAVAAAELALLAGAERVEGCLFGNGERTGNVDLVTLALNMYTQGIDPGLDFSDIDAIAAEYKSITGMPIHPRHPYVGECVYTSFSGTHQDAIHKVLSKTTPETIPWNVPYLPIDPTDVGRAYDGIIRINSQSGKGGIDYVLKNFHGIRLDKAELAEFSRFVKNTFDNLVTHQELIRALHAFRNSISA